MTAEPRALDDIVPAFIVFFFFQAEDGIRDYKVTGVQTCALPISSLPGGLYGRGGYCPASGSDHLPTLQGESDAGPGHADDSPDSAGSLDERAVLCRQGLRSVREDGIPGTDGHHGDRRPDRPDARDDLGGSVGARVAPSRPHGPDDHAG